jgi:hypothetical protein
MNVSYPAIDRALKAMKNRMIIERGEQPSSREEENVRTNDVAAVVKSSLRSSKATVAASNESCSRSSTLSNLAIVAWDCAEKEYNEYKEWKLAQLFKIKMCRSDEIVPLKHNL